MIKKGTITIQTQKVTRNIETASNTKNHPQHKKYKLKENRQRSNTHQTSTIKHKTKTPPKKQVHNNNKDETQLLLGKVTREPRNNTKPKVLTDTMTEYT